MGHVLKKHRTDLSDPVQKRNQEIEADAFAIEVMRRIGQFPLGVEFWFDLERNGHVDPLKFSTKGDWQKYLASLDHPVTKERLEALADTVEKASDAFARNQTNQAFWSQRYKGWAQYFRKVEAQWSIDSIPHAAEYSRVQELHLEDLKPRKSAFVAPGSEHEPDLNGLFAVRRTAANGEQDIVDLLLLRSSDDGVMGGYKNAKVNGFIEGKIKNGVLHFTWREGNAKGSGVAQSEGDTLRGTWGAGDAEQGAGELKGVRVRPKKDSNPK
jgi:hypothetical protein